MEPSYQQRVRPPIAMTPIASLPTSLISTTPWESGLKSVTPVFQTRTQVFAILLVLITPVPFIRISIVPVWMALVPNISATALVHMIHYGPPLVPIPTLVLTKIVHYGLTPIPKGRGSQIFMPLCMCPIWYRCKSIITKSCFSWD